jgi:hypothetical protein
MNSLGRTPKITRSALLPFVCQNHIAIGVLLVLGTNTTSNLNSYAPTTAETTREQAIQRGRLDRVWGRLDRLHQATKKSSETPLPSTKTHHGFTNIDLWSRTSWLTPRKLHENDPRFHQNAPLIKANELTEENPAKPKPSPGTPRAVRPPHQVVRLPLPEIQPAGQTSTSHRPTS